MKHLLSIYHFLSILLTFTVLVACNMIDYHPYDGRISGPTGINHANIMRIEHECYGKDTLRVVVTGDSQRWYDETKEFVAHVNKQKGVDFVIHGGDISDFGVTDEFIWQRDILQGLHMPYVVLIGNHDYLGTGEESFRCIFGNPNFSFIAGRVKFLCLDTNALENDYSRPIPDFEYMTEEQTARADLFDRTVVCMHIRPYMEEFNNNVAKVFQHYVTQMPGLLFCTAAHNHYRDEVDLFKDGVIYYMSDNIKRRSYYLFTITPDGYECEVIFF